MAKIRQFAQERSTALYEQLSTYFQPLAELLANFYDSGGLLVDSLPTKTIMDDVTYKAVDKVITLLAGGDVKSAREYAIPYKQDGVVLHLQYAEYTEQETDRTVYGYYSISDSPTNFAEAKTKCLIAVDDDVDGPFAYINNQIGVKENGVTEYINIYTLIDNLVQTAQEMDLIEAAASCFLTSGDTGAVSNFVETIKSKFTGFKDDALAMYQQLVAVIPCGASSFISSIKGLFSSIGSSKYSEADDTWTFAEQGTITSDNWWCSTIGATLGTLATVIGGIIMAFGKVAAACVYVVGLIVQGVNSLITKMTYSDLYPTTDDESINRTYGCYVINEILGTSSPEPYNLYYSIFRNMLQTHHANSLKLTINGLEGWIYVYQTYSGDISTGAWTGTIGWTMYPSFRYDVTSCVVCDTWMKTPAGTSTTSTGAIRVSVKDTIIPHDKTRPDWENLGENLDFSGYSDSVRSALIARILAAQMLVFILGSCDVETEWDPSQFTHGSDIDAETRTIAGSCSYAEQNWNATLGWHPNFSSATLADALSTAAWLVAHKDYVQTNASVAASALWTAIGTMIEYYPYIIGMPYVIKQSGNYKIDASSAAVNMRSVYMDAFGPDATHTNTVDDYFIVTARGNDYLFAPKYSETSMYRGILIMSMVCIVIGGAAAYGTIKWRRFAKQKAFKYTTDAERAWQKTIDDGYSKESYREYRKAVFKNNTIGRLFGSAKINKVNYWGDTDDTSLSETANSVNALISSDDPSTPSLLDIAQAVRSWPKDED